MMQRESGEEGGTYPGRGCTYPGQGYLPWPRGYLLWAGGYLPWLWGTYPGQGVPTLLGVPTLAGGLVRGLFECFMWRNDWSNVMKMMQRDSGEETGASQDVQNTVWEVFNHALFKGMSI